MKQNAIFLFCVLAVAACLTAGCTTSYHINTPDYIPVYPKLKTPVPLTAGLIVPQETLDYAHSVPLARWEVGQAVSSHMASGLKAAFKNVVVLAGGKPDAGVDIVVTCTLGQQSKFKPGLLVTSDHAVTIELICKTTDTSNVSLWDGHILQTDIFNAGIIGKMLIATSLTSIFVSNVDVQGAVDSFGLVVAGGSNNNLVIAVNRMMEKMVNEGRLKICPKCGDDTDWRKIVQDTDVH